MTESRAWFRLYTEFAFDPKVQLLDETLQRRYVMLLCAAAAGLSPFHAVSEVAFLLRIPVSECEETRSALVSRGLITDDWWPVAWDKRQFESDSSTARVKRFRKRQQAVTETVTETPSEQSRSEQRQSRAEQSRGRASESSKSGSARNREPRAFDPESDQAAFERIKAAYPKFAGRQDWINAEHYCHLRLGEDVTWDELLAGVERYAKHIRALGKEGTQYVLAPGKFFNAPDRPWSQEWPLPDAKPAKPLNGTRRLSTGEIIEQAIREGFTDEQISDMPELAEWPTLRRDIREKRQEIDDHAR